MTIKLYEHQEIGVKFLRSGKYKLLADEMGVGKSGQVIAASGHLKKILIVCPATAKINWQREFVKFEGRESTVIGLKDKQPSSNIIISNYERVVRDPHKYKRVPWDLVVLDEVHYCKTPSAARTAALFGKEGLIHSAERVWCLSGTPAPNHIGELWVLLYTFGHTKLSYEGFVNRYCNVIPNPKIYAAQKITGTKTQNAHEIKAVLDTFMLRRKLKDVIPTMPSLSMNTVAIESTYNPLKDFPEMKEKLKEEWKLLKQKMDITGLHIDDDKLLGMLTMMAASISSIRRYHGLKKVPVVADIIEGELDSGEYKKIIIFGVHTDILKMMKSSLKKFNPQIIIGSTTQSARQIAIDKFQNDPTCQVFIGNITSAGTAITLTAANQVAFIEQDWVPGNNAQAVSRAWRISQELPVLCRFFSLPGFDEKLSLALERKIREISTFMS